MIPLTWKTINESNHFELGLLLRECFPVRENASFFDDFPYWSPKLRTDKFQIGAWDEHHRLVASASIRIGRLVTHPNKRIAIIGAVATLPNFRGQGIGKIAIEKLIEEGAQRKVDAFFLWTGQEEFYQQFGFHAFSKQNRIDLNDIDCQSKLGPTLIHEGLTPEVFELLRQRKYGLELFDDDYDWYERHFNTRWYWIERNKKPLAYMAIGRGIDLEGIIHEFGGEALALETLFSLIKKQNPNLQVMCHPLIKESYSFLNRAPSGLIETMCMAKFIHPDFKQMELRGIWFWGLDAC